MNRFLTAISVALVVVVAVMGLMIRDQDRRLRAVEQRLTARPASVAVRSAGTKLTEADKRRLDREVEDLILPVLRLKKVFPSL